MKNIFIVCEGSDEDVILNKVKASKKADVEVSVTYPLEWNEDFECPAIVFVAGADDDVEEVTSGLDDKNYIFYTENAFLARAAQLFFDKAFSSKVVMSTSVNKAFHSGDTVVKVTFEDKKGKEGFATFRGCDFTLEGDFLFERFDVFGA